MTYRSGRTLTKPAGKLPFYGTDPIGAVGNSPPLRDHSPIGYSTRPGSLRCAALVKTAGDQTNGARIAVDHHEDPLTHGTAQQHKGKVAHGYLRQLRLPLR